MLIVTTTDGKEHRLPGEWRITYARIGGPVVEGFVGDVVSVTNIPEPCAEDIPK